MIIASLFNLTGRDQREAEGNWRFVIHIHAAIIISYW